MPKPFFSTSQGLADQITAYFENSGSAYELETQPVNTQNSLPKKTAKTEPATITGLALFLGFSSRKAFENYERRGKFADTLKRGRLQVEAEYEKKLHQPSPSGAIFALKSLGWNEKPDTETNGAKGSDTLKVAIFDTGIQPAASEKEVSL